jgi:protein-disulfide isomerase
MVFGHTGSAGQFPEARPTRRWATAFVLLAAMAVAACDSGGSSSSQTARTPEEVELRPGDMILGDPNAPVTIVEYASVTCSHCASFHANTMPELKEKYIDTGKVKLVFREFPTAPSELAAAGFLLARCAGEDRYFQVIETLLERQQDWVFERDGLQRVANFRALAAQMGMPGPVFDQCLENPEALAQMRETQIHANEVLGVNSTPSFVVGGQTIPGAISFQRFEELLAPYFPESE